MLCSYLGQHPVTVLSPARLQTVVESLAFNAGAAPEATMMHAAWKPDGHALPGEKMLNIGS